MSTPSDPKPVDDRLNEDEHDGLTFEIVEEEQTQEGRVRSRGIYLVPNSITTAALLSGFYSIIASTNGNYLKAIAAIFLAALLDGLDGRAARMLNAQSPFGEQFDSLSDMLSFGVAPAILIYSWALAPFGRLGMACAFIFTACAAFRLARFNVQIGVVSKKYFVGLASPLAAILVASGVWVGIDNPDFINITQIESAAAYAALVVIAGMLMISNVRYFSFKEFDRKRVPFMMMIPIVLAMVAVTYNVPVGLFVAGLIYALSGLWTTLRIRSQRHTA